GEAVEPPADEVAQRVAAERERRQADDVQQQHERAEADPELEPAAVRVEEERAAGVVPEEREHDDREVEEVPMRVLEDQREPALAAVALPAGARAGRRGQEVGAVVGLAVVVTSGTKTERRPE